MSTRHLAESIVALVEKQIQDNIGAALAGVAADRNDDKVTLEVPKEYIRFENAKGYRLPAVFTVVRTMRMNNAERGANHINATADLIVSILIGERTQSLLVTKSWRYQAALHEVLHLAQLTTVDSKVKIVTKVEEVHFGPELTDTQDKTDPQSVFRKEVGFLIHVEHWENL